MKARWRRRLHALWCRGQMTPEHRYEWHGFLFRTQTGAPYHGRHFADDSAVMLNHGYRPRHASGQMWAPWTPEGVARAQQ